MPPFLADSKTSLAYYEQAGGGFLEAYRADVRSDQAGGECV